MTNTTNPPAKQIASFSHAGKVGRIYSDGRVIYSGISFTAESATGELGIRIRQTLAKTGVKL